jgi:hypothetical protein
MGGQLQVKIDVQGPMPIDELAKSGAKLAALSGTGELKLTDAEQAAIKKHVAAGGTLLVEAVGGDEAFGKSAAAMLAAMYGEKALQRLDINHPLYRIKGLEITRVDFTRAMWRRDGYVLDRQPRLCGAEVDGRLAVVFSEQDITAALLGRSFGMSAGYRPDSAFEILRNVVLYAGGVAAEP